MNTPYESLDQGIVAAIAGGAYTFAAVVAHGDLLAIATALAAKDRWGKRDGSRVIDRRLQALRKSGRLAFAGRRWVITMSRAVASAARAGDAGAGEARKTAPDRPVRELAVTSRHLPDYLLINRLDGTAWAAVEVGATEATWRAVDPNPLTVLRAHAEGRLLHLNRGSCPDSIEGPESRDPACPVCRALEALEPAARDQEER